MHVQFSERAQRQSNSCAARRTPKSSGLTLDGGAAVVLRDKRSACIRLDSYLADDDAVACRAPD